MIECKTNEVFAGTYTPLSPENFDPDAMRALACAVLRKAVSKATRGDVATRAWFARKNSNLEFWCQVLNIDPAAVCDGVEKIPHTAPTRAASRIV